MSDDSCSFLDSQPFITDVSLKSFNADKKSKALMDYIEKLAAGRRTANILLPIGCDRQWSNAKYQFDQIDKVMQYVNQKYAEMGKDVALFYSTAGAFTSAVKGEKQAWPITHGDLTASFAEQGAPLSVLAGGYSSRPNLKKQLKDASAINLAAQKMFAYSALKLNATAESTSLLEEALRSQEEWTDVLGVGLSQNVIRGTLKERVAADFSTDLHKAVEATRQNYGKTLSYWLKETEGINMVGGLQWCVGS